MAKKISEQMLEMTNSDMMMPFQFRGSDTLTANSCKVCMRQVVVVWGSRVVVGEGEGSK